MRIKFLTFLASAAVTLFMLSTTGYGRTFCDRDGLVNTAATHSHTHAVNIAENPIAKSEGLQNTTVSSNLAAVKKTTNAHDDAAANRERSLLINSGELNAEVETVPGETASPKTAAPTSVSKWLEKRANEEIAGDNHANHSHEEEFLQDEGIEIVGGGWCNSCGCWMRHGCDTNGNCNISHGSVCGSGYCSLHPLSPCFNSN